MDLILYLGFLFYIYFGIFGKKGDPERNVDPSPADNNPKASPEKSNILVKRLSSKIFG